MSTALKLIAIVGPTGAGKTALSLFLAKEFDGEVISADSRQVYKELSIGTAKPAGHWERVQGERRYVAGGVVHHLVDAIDPAEEFTLPDFMERAVTAINNIHLRGRLPFLVGGTGQYVYAVLENWQIPRVAPDRAFRSRMRKYSADNLDKKLRKIDPSAADTAQMNPRRLIRALEIYKKTGKRPSGVRSKGPTFFNALKIGTPLPDNYTKMVRERVEKMVKRGLLEEIHGLVKKYSWELPAMASIDYQEFRAYLAGEETLEKAKESAVQAQVSFAKRQMTWFKRDKEIHWVKDKEEGLRFVREFLDS